MMSDFLHNPSVQGVADWLKNNLYWIAPITITVILTFISVKVMKDQKNRQETQICVDLMEKRLAVFGAIEEAFHSIADNDVNQSTLRTFRFKSKGVSYLFGNDVIEYCANIDRLLNEISYLNAKTKRSDSSNQVDPDYDKYIDRKYKLESQDAAILEDSLVGVFKLYMDFSEYKVRK